MTFSKIIAFKATMALIALLCLRETSNVDRTKRIAARFFGVVFLLVALFAWTDVEAEDDQYVLCVTYTLTNEFACMLPTDLHSCKEAKEWFEEEASWHGENKYECLTLKQANERGRNEK